MGGPLICLVARNMAKVGSLLVNFRFVHAFVLSCTEYSHPDSEAF